MTRSRSSVRLVSGPNQLRKASEKVKPIWMDSEAPQLKSRLAQLYRQIADFLRTKDDKPQMVPLFQALTTPMTRSRSSVRLVSGPNQLRKASEKVKPIWIPA
jgi:hypothetical protein